MNTGIRICMAREVAMYASRGDEPMARERLRSFSDLCPTSVNRAGGMVWLRPTRRRHASPSGARMRSESARLSVLRFWRTHGTADSPTGPVHPRQAVNTTAMLAVTYLTPRKHLTKR